MSGNTSQYSPSLFNQYIIAFEGSSIAGILYGVYLVIAGINISLLKQKRHRFILSFTIAQLVITTLYMGMSLYAAPAQLSGIFNIVDTYGRYGGPNVLFFWPAVFVNCAFVLNTLISDAFLLYRCYVVWMGNKYVLASASVFYVATFGTSLAWLIVSGIANATHFTHAVQVTGICYWTFSAAMNVIVSCFISVRLWMHRQAISEAAGPQHSRFYLSYMVMTLESAILYAAFAIIALIMFVANSPLRDVFFPVLGNIQVISPALIIYRIARGTSFESDEYGNVTSVTMRFAPSDFRNNPYAQRLNRSDTIRGRKTDCDGFNSFVLDESREDV